MLKNYQECNKKQRALIENAFNLSPSGILIKDKKFNTLFANELFYLHANFLSSNAQYQDFLNKIEHEIINKKIEKNFDIETSGVFINFTLKPLVENGKIKGLIYYTRNVTNEKSLNLQKETYVATLCHDLKNPAIGQIKALELLTKGAFGKVEKEQNEIISIILDSCKYLKSMLDGFLGTYSANSGVTVLNCIEQSILPLVEECISDILYISSEKGIKIDFNYPKNCDFSASFDKIQLRRVIMNLLTNGVKYAHKNSILKIELSENENNIIFQFENKSEYISKENQKKIFKKYVSYAETLHERGVGLGLYISKKIIEAHGGEIYLKSYKNNRTIFGFSIPKISKENSLLSF